MSEQAYTRRQLSVVFLRTHSHPVFVVLMSSTCLGVCDGLREPPPVAPLTGTACDFVSGSMPCCRGLLARNPSLSRHKFGNDYFAPLTAHTPYTVQLFK